MTTVYIERRLTAKGKVRYVVRYRLGGRMTTLFYGGSFQTQKEARARRDWIAGEIAAMRVPNTKGLAQRSHETFAVVARRWRESRLDVAAETQKSYGTHLKRMLPTFGRADPASITPEEVQAWVAAIADELEASSVSRYMATLRQILDFAGIQPNPARDRNVRLPRILTAEPQPPSLAEFRAILEHVPPRWRLALRLMEATAMRVGEVSALTCADCDFAGARLRISRLRTKGNTAGQRWVQVPVSLMEEIAALIPPDDRVPARRVFPLVSADAAKNAMARACTAAGIAHYHPHDLRHRRLSLWHHQGVPARELAARAGHSRASMTLDQYAHVLVDDKDEWA
jgi:integrase